MIASVAMLLYVVGVVFFVGLPPIILMVVVVDSKNVYDIIHYVVYCYRAYGLKSLLGDLLRRKQDFFKESARVDALAEALEHPDRRIMVRITGAVFLSLLFYSVLSVLLMSKILTLLENVFFGG